MSTAPSLARTRPQNWKALAPAPSPGPTFAAQSALPRLPVPALADTLANLKESLRPIAWDAGEYAQAVRTVDEFATGPAQELHARLESRARQTAHWLEEWWDDAAYLTYRDSVRILIQAGVYSEMRMLTRCICNAIRWSSMCRIIARFHPPSSL